jgi:hypothetical protein
MSAYKYNFLTRVRALLLILVMGLTPVLATPVNVKAASAKPEIVSYGPGSSRSKWMRDDMAISSDSRYLAFADYKVDYSQNYQITVRDRVTGVSTVQLTEENELEAFNITNGGRYLYFTSGKKLDSLAQLDTGSHNYVYVKDLNTGEIALASVGPGIAFWDSSSYRILTSDDGTILVGQCSESQRTICRRDIVNQTTTTYPVTGYLSQLSGNGRYMFYYDNLTDEFKRYDSQTSTVQNIPISPASGGDLKDVSYDGNYVLMEKWASTAAATEIRRVSISSGSIENLPTNGRYAQISGDGTVVIFQDEQLRPNYWNYYVRVGVFDFKTSTTTYPVVNEWGHEPELAIQPIGSFGPYNNRVTFDGTETIFTSFSSTIGCLDQYYGKCGFVAPTAGPTIIGSDTVAPQAPQINSGSIFKESSTTVSFTASATDDNSGVGAAEFFLDGAANYFYEAGSNAYTSPGRGVPMQISNGVMTGTLLNDIPPGTYTMYVRVQDKAGNWSAKSNIQVQVIDNTAPSGGFTGQSLVIRPRGQTITGTATDVSSGISAVTLSTGSTVLSSNSGDIQFTSVYSSNSCPPYAFLVCTWTVDSSKLPRGQNTYTLTITDRSGNSYSVTVTRTVI